MLVFDKESTLIQNPLEDDIFEKSKLLPAVTFNEDDFDFLN